MMKRVIVGVLVFFVLGRVSSRSPLRQWGASQAGGSVLNIEVIVIRTIGRYLWSKFYSVTLLFSLACSHVLCQGFNYDDMLAPSWECNEELYDQMASLIVNDSLYRYLVRSEKRLEGYYVCGKLFGSLTPEFFDYLWIQSVCGDTDGTCPDAYMWCYRAISARFKGVFTNEINQTVKSCPSLRHVESDSAGSLIYFSPIWGGRFVVAKVVGRNEGYRIDAQSGAPIDDIIAMSSFASTVDYLFELKDSKVIQVYRY